MSDITKQSYLKTFAKWLANQDKDTQARYCEHGHYVGFKRALAYMCPDCPEQ